MFEVSREVPSACSVSKSIFNPDKTKHLARFPHVGQVT